MPIIQHDTITSACISSKHKDVILATNDEDSSIKHHNFPPQYHQETLDTSVSHITMSTVTPVSVDDAPTSVSATTTTTAETEFIDVVDRRSLRLYSKKHRVYMFREFILRTYSDYLSASPCGRNETNTSIILDIAGGKGDLSWILHNIDNCQSIVIDPRCTINHIHKSVEYLRRFPDECKKRSIPHQSSYQPLAALMPVLEEKDYHMESPLHMRIFVDEELVQVLQSIWMDDTPHRYEQWDIYWTKATQRTIDHITPSGKNDFSLDRVTVSESSNNITHSQTALQYILQAKLIVGYHPDQATDACFTLAQLLKIPVCVVPCCVFPSEFPNRRLYDTAVSPDCDEVDCLSGRPVEKYDDLIQYLRQQYPYLEVDTLDFPGTTTARRIVLYTHPPPKIVEGATSNRM